MTETVLGFRGRYNEQCNEISLVNLFCWQRALTDVAENRFLMSRPSWQAVGDACFARCDRVSSELLALTYVWHSVDLDTYISSGVHAHCLPQGFLLEIGP